MDEHTLRVLGVAGTWLSGIGTLLAVVVALYLARAENAVRLKVHAGHRLIITPGEKTEDEVLNIGVANVGARAVVIKNVLWKMGVFRRRYAVQVTGSAMDSLRIHQRLDPGHQGSFYIELDPNDNENWIRRFATNIPKHFKWLWLRRLRIGISTAVNVTVWAPVEDSLRKKLLQARTEIKPARPD